MSRVAIAAYLFALTFMLAAAYSIWFRMADFSITITWVK